MNFKTDMKIFFATCALAGLAVAADYTAWTGHRGILLNTSATGANVAGNVHNFPVLIRLGGNEAAILSAAGTGGASLRFSKADNATPLPYQIESWTATSAAIWVKVDTILGNNAAQTIRMHWGNGAAASESNGAAVFDTANGFRGVWHLGPDSVGVSKDATANKNHATQQGAATAIQGTVGGARRLNASGAGDIDTVGINQTFNMSISDRLTVSAWVRRDGSNSGGSQFEGIAGVFDWNRNGTGVNNRMYSLVHNANNGFSFHVSSTGGDGANEVIVNTGILADANWTHAAATVDGSNIRVYVNGVSAIQSAYTGNIYFPTTLTGVGPFTIGMLDDNGSGEGQYFNGGVDEVRLSGIARSADWMKLEFENQKTVNSLADIGLPTAPGAPTGVTGVAGAVNSGRINVSWTAPASDGGASVTSYKVMAVGDTAKTCTAVGALTCGVTSLASGASYTFQVRAYNAVGSSALSAASAPVNAPVPVLGGDALMLNVGSFTNAYTFRLSDRLAGTTDRLVMNILDVSGNKVWSRSLSPSEAGREISWNGKTSTGARASAGIYFVRVFTVTAAGKMEAVQGGVTLGR
jgi:hypothetical protein